jgi:hypothetical protein
MGHRSADIDGRSRISGPIRARARGPVDAELTLNTRVMLWRENDALLTRFDALLSERPPLREFSHQYARPREAWPRQKRHGERKVDTNARALRARRRHEARS